MKEYKPILSASINRKGVLDIDTVKGCSMGMAKYPNGGCYGLCYAVKTANLYNYNFSKSVSRRFDENKRQLNMFGAIGSRDIARTVINHKLSWFRIGVMGDPCHNWRLTTELCEWLGEIKTPVIVTKHWVKIPDNLIKRLKNTRAVFNTSISALDTKDEINYRLEAFNFLKKAGFKSVLRIVSCKFGDTNVGAKLNKIQNELFKNYPVIDNPLRIPPSDKRIINGHIKVTRRKDINSNSYISISNNETYIGSCKNCPDQCGVL